MRVCLQQVETIVAEYFASGDVPEVAASIEDLEAPVGEGARFGGRWLVLLWVGLHMLVGALQPALREV